MKVVRILTLPIIFLVGGISQRDGESDGDSLGHCFTKTIFKGTDDVMETIFIF